jgi:catechol 2,3-dioxygenase-like lactoylglutathione lyase family enzyme
MVPLARIIIFVADVPRMAAFYREHFGLRPIPSPWPADEWQELDAGGCGIAFHRAHGAGGPTGSPDNPHKLAFACEDVAARRAALVACGVPMDELQTFGDVTLCDGSDPEGHRFQITNPR